MKMYKREGNSVTYPVNNGLLQVVVCNENIMQVKYTTAKTFDTKKSLFLEDNAFTNTPYTVNENPIEIVIATNKLKAKIDKKTGGITFYDKEGKVILKEVVENGRSQETLPQTGTDKK
ncbi:hypothetical protein RCH18_001193 [Flavobacterium sp. PL11]|jgi:alpha-D-xyloside xylohydrolase|uniref:DUF4968 domain-containing protein n=1 Tax=Flavobacterium sp. PL11 TaxID=3071717 RepID=UPI002DFB9E71|nr:hypothetical protein [Flavobacterium sp. PL11]